MSDMKNQNPVIDAAVKAAMTAVTETAKSKDNKMSTPAVRDARPALVEAMTEAMEADPAVQFSTNTEAYFWQKRSFWGAAGAGVSLAFSIATALIAYMEANTIDTTDYGKIATSLFGAVFAAWGGYLSWRAGRAKLPLFTESYPLNRG